MPAAQKSQVPQSFRNPLEMMRDEIKHTGADLSNIPKDMLQESSDQMWAAIYGTKPTSEKMKTITGSEEQDRKMGYTYLDVEKLRKAQASGDMKQVEAVNEKIQAKGDEHQEKQASHRAYMAEIERAIQELEQEEQERQRQIAEEEAQKRQQEEEERAAMQQNSSDGAAKTKGRLGGARPKASVETNFEASKGRTGK
jgi:septal ring factor EnvC (AmiA/AmiB activator)